jgi:hypothetical protein
MLPQAFDVYRRSMPCLCFFIASLNFCTIGRQSAKAEYIMNPDGIMVPNLTTCARANFPTQAKSIVSAADVDVILTIDKFGDVIRTDVIKVTLVTVTDRKRAEDTIPFFKAAAKKAFGVPRCPISYEKGRPVEFSIMVPVKYRDDGGPGVLIKISE